MDETTIYPPREPREGVFRLYVLMGASPHAIKFSERFEVLGIDPVAVHRESNRLYEFHLVVLRDGSRFRFFVSDALAYLAALAKLEGKTRKDIADAKDEAYWLSATM